MIVDSAAYCFTFPGMDSGKSGNHAHDRMSAGFCGKRSRLFPITDSSHGPEQFVPEKMQNNHPILREESSADNGFGSRYQAHSRFLNPRRS